MRASRLHDPMGVMALLCALSLPLTAACAANSPGAVTVQDDRGHRIQLPTLPLRIVSLSPSLTETVCALGACARLVGVDRYSNWPARVQALPTLGGLDDTPIERLVALKPDLVLVARSARATERLEGLGLRVLALEPQSLADTERVINTLALALGDAPAGPALWRQLDARITAAAARVPAALRGKQVYFEVAESPYAAGESSFIGQILKRLGLMAAVPAALGPFPLLSPEYVLRAQPDIVMASARALQGMAARPGWSMLKALQTHQACGFEPARWDPLVRAGPRLAEAAETLADCLAGLPVP